MVPMVRHTHTETLVLFMVVGLHTMGVDDPGGSFTQLATKVIQWMVQMVGHTCSDLSLWCFYFHGTVYNSPQIRISISK